MCVCARKTRTTSRIITERGEPTEITQREKQKQRKRKRNRKREREKKTERHNKKTFQTTGR